MLNPGELEEARKMEEEVDGAAVSKIGTLLLHHPSEVYPVALCLQ